MLGETISHYRITAKLGQGGMGEVWLAEDIRLGHRVAIKRLPTSLAGEREARARFQREARAVAQLRHPNIVTLLEFDEIQGEYVLITEYVPGGSLRTRAHEGQQPLGWVLRWGVQAAEGLAEAHRRGVLHRDIKPDNLLLTDEGDLRIADFGLARLEDSTRMTLTGSTMGTLAYTAPEQARGEEVDERADLFALGATLYELLAGASAFAGNTRAATLRAVLEDTPPPLSERRRDMPAGMQELIDRLLAKDPDSRPRSAQEVADALRAVADEADLGKTLPLSVTRPFVLPRRVKVRPGSVAILTATLLVVAVVMHWRFTPHATRQPSALQQSVRTVAILPFGNLVDTTDTDRIGAIIANLLGTDISDSRFLRVASGQRTRNLLNPALADGQIAVGPAKAKDLGEQLGVELIVQGNVLQTDPTYIVTSQIMDVKTGAILLSQSFRGEPEEDVFPVVDRIARAVRSSLDLPEEALLEEDRPVSHVTTRSLEAYRFYVDGLHFRDAYNWEEAPKAFARAVEIDSTFAMAYVELSYYRDTRSMLERAMRFSDHATLRERRFIEAKYLRSSGEPDEAIAKLESLIADYPDDAQAYEELATIHYRMEDGASKALPLFQKVIELDPFDRGAHNFLAGSYFRLGDWENTVRVMDDYVALAPDEPNAHHTFGDFYAWTGRLEEARTAFIKTLELYETAPMVRNQLAAIALLRKEYTEAESYLWTAANDSRTISRNTARRMVPIVYMYQGKLTDALDAASAAMDDLSAGGDYRWALYYRTLIRMELGDWGQAFADAESLVARYARARRGDRNPWRGVQVRVLTQMGDYDAAEELLMQTQSEFEPRFYATEKAWIELGRDRPDSAYAALERFLITSSEVERAQLINSDFDYEGYMAAAVSCLYCGRLSEAIRRLERMLWAYDYLYDDPFLAVRTHYYLGLAYERSGWTEEAIEQLEEFLSIWENTDHPMRDLADARRRLAALRE